MTPGKPRLPANSERLRELMRGAMIRNTRAVVALKLPRRHASTIKVDGRPGETEAYAELAAAARRARSGARGAGRHRLALHHLLRRGGLLAGCGCGAVARFAARRPDDTAWQALAERWAAIAAGGKEAALIDLLAAQSGGEEARLRPFPRDACSPRRAVSHKAALPFARFDGSLSGPEKDAAIDEFREQRAGAAVHGIRRRGPQHPVLQHADQFRCALESDGDRAAHRPHRPHRAEPRGVHLQSRHARHAGGAGAHAAGREDLHVRAGGRRGRRDPRRPRRGARFPRPGA